MRLVCASANAHKAAELAALVAPHELLPRPPGVPDVVEDAPDYLGNARLKAVALAEATGLPALADDSGIEVEGLGGRPGVLSARYAGEGASDAERRALLLRELGSAEGDARRARFVAVAVVRWPHGREVVAEGVVTGRIAEAERGAGGFGYDPLFVPDEGDGRTFAEMDPAEKHDLSHRGRAVRALLAQLPAP